MWTFVCQRRILCEKVIHQGDHEKAGIYQLLSDRKLLGIVTMANHFNCDIVLEFYANLKSDISVAKSPCCHKIIVRSHEFDFSP